MKCGACGAGNSDEATECRWCGQMLQEADSQGGGTAPGGRRPINKGLAWPCSQANGGILAILLVLVLLSLTEESVQDHIIGFILLFALLGCIVTVIGVVTVLVDLAYLDTPKETKRPSIPHLIVNLLMIPLSIGCFLMAINHFFDNFKAVTRDKRAQIQTDMRTMAIALETYYLDNNEYPAWSAKRSENAFGGLQDKNNSLNNLPTFRLRNDTQLGTLTTPISYTSNYFSDPYSPVKGATFCYWVDKRTPAPGFIVWSAGPDGVYDLNLDNISWAYHAGEGGATPLLIDLTYDPSNGTKSNGDVWRIKE